MYQELRECGDVCTRILAQNQAVIRELVARLKKRPPSIIVTCARGSSDHAASFAKTIFETKLGIMVVSYAPSMSTIFETKFRNMENALFIVISQSGKSPDLLASLRAAKASGALCVGIVNDTTSPVAALADFVLPMQAGTEKSVAATKSYIGGKS
ncbi:MAG: putative phosphosugar isomerase [Hyphomonadaceae bacterium]|nr:MAG: putative phosphosugar isomerase [Hyphomonadaceae bacterium]